MNKILKHIMKILRIIIFSLVFFLGLNKASFACDFLGINIGGNKSEIEKYFGTFENDDEEELRDITIVSTGIDRFCPNSNLGNSIIYAFIVNDKIAGISIEVLNGTNNEESKKKLLYNYVTSNYGKIENSTNPNWTGYKMWSIGGREIIYGKTYQRKKFLIEELQISNAEYMPYLIDNEPNDE
jgi:hypothetical protein|tara:strand:+ start:303 stop:851 length:549 start_codon:yes stop_codon:yes gene_type:complete